MDYPFLTEIDTADEIGELLRKRIRRVLARMEMLPEARAMTFGLGTHGGTPNHLPPELQKKVKRGSRPPRDRSLFERYYWEFEQCPKRRDPQAAFALLCTCAERDYLHAIEGPGESAVAGNLWHISEGQARGNKEREVFEQGEREKLVAEYEGAPASLVAEIIQQPVGWVQKARELEGREPDTGYRKEGWKGLTEQERVKAVADCEAQGMTQPQAAGHLGTSERSVRRRWPPAHKRQGRRAA